MCIDEGKITQLICPEQKCSANLSDIFLQSALTEDLFERLEDENFHEVIIFINLATWKNVQLYSIIIIIVMFTFISILGM